MASKNLYGAEGSVAGESTKSAEGAYPRNSSGFTRIVDTDAPVSVTWGPTNKLMAPGVLPYDYAAALSQAPIAYTVTTNRVMPLAEAGTVLRGLIKACGAEGQSDAVQMALHRAILLAHIKNSASVAQPKRAVFQVEGGAQINFFLSVVDPLGEDTRRFFRAFADMQRDMIASILARHREGDASVAEDVRDIMWVAADRGLQRFPTLIADSADACTGLTLSEQAALGSAKATIFANSTNVVDVIRQFRSVAPGPDVAPTPASNNQSYNPASRAGPGY